MERKSLVLSDVVLKADEATGQIVGVANTSKKDRQADTMTYGCWKKVIGDKQQPAIIWSHNVSGLDVRGKVLGLEELAPGDLRIGLNQKTAGEAKASGLLFQAQMAMETQAGRDAFALLKGGFVKQFSVQFSIAPDGEESDGKGGRIVKLVDELFEISPVLVGASYGTGLLMAKALELARGDAENATDWRRLIHDLTAGDGDTCKTFLAAIPVAEPQPPIEPLAPEPSTTAAALDVTALTANVLAFARTLGTLRGDDLVTPPA